MQYNVKNDGKLHTRFSDLMRATPHQVENIIKEQLGEKERFKSDVILATILIQKMRAVLY